MPKLLVFQHVPYEILGTLDPLLRGAGFRIRYTNFGRTPEAKPSVAGYDGLVVLGGPMNVGQTDRHPHLLAEQNAIREALDADLPILGICLGAQLIAATLGAGVGPSLEKEIGWYDLQRSAAGETDPLLRHLQPTERIFQWHGDGFELPPGAVHLASSPACPNQAFRVGEKVYGFQFHMEVDQPMIERWLRLPSHIDEIESLGGRVSRDAILEETPGRMPRLSELSGNVFGAFLNLFGPRERHTTLASR